MPIDDEINLDSPDGITEEDIRRMNEEADQLEAAAQKAENAAKKIKDSTKGMNFAQLNMIQGTPEQVDMASMGGGTLSEDMKEEIENLKQEIEAIKNRSKKNSKKIDEEAEARKAEIKKFREQKSEIGEMQGAIDGIRNNPFGFGKSKVMGMLGKAGIWGMVAQFAVDIGQQVYNEVLTEVKKQFGAGGAWDKRKLVEDVLNEYNSIEYLTRVKSGGVFFTADAGQDLRQGAARGANNTRDLRDGHVRYLQFHYNE